MMHSRKIAAAFLILITAVSRDAFSSDSAKSAQRSPELFARALIITDKVDGIFYYCYMDILHYKQYNSKNCELTYNSMERSASMLSFSGFDRKDHITISKILQFLSTNTGSK
ncbi:hypothetical protein ASG68_25215 [Rhizobium sp. Leaf453]|nr:hypothetical protein ASG50_15235 [Rhizobium sp. Leaf386]KQU06039.1 hypothetical protein ASG68_25215 [Rhizobium sp. Leaf453]